MEEIIELESIKINNAVEKQCFIIMPIGNKEGYKDSHFKRVYTHLIKPAVIKAGFEPLRADDIKTTNHIVLDIIRKIIDSDMALCDLSSQNPNVLYELGIRQSFDKPVTLIKDDVTSRIFDIQGIRDLEYDSELRIDKVEEQIEKLADLIKNTYANRSKEVNSLVKLLSIEAAELNENTKISLDTELILNSISELNSRIGRLEIEKILTEKNGKIPRHNLIENIEILERFTLEELRELKNGSTVVHPKFGVGVFGDIDQRDVMNITFPTDSKRLMAPYVKLYKPDSA
ncbi:MAG TPA: hypothetical protein PKD18_02100 [Saprospiraceae bacterium]|nr:hypothetical protein [Saprospiraceae bacterium]